MATKCLSLQPWMTLLPRWSAGRSWRRKVAVVFECSQGRHLSVGAAGILYQIMQPLVPRIRLVHASQRNWGTTCAGECAECRRGPTRNGTPRALRPAQEMECLQAGALSKSSGQGASNTARLSIAWAVPSKEFSTQSVLWMQ